jgi:hypothetical protein
MGFFSGEPITGAARVLSDALKERGVVRYSEFYDGEEQTEKRLAGAMGIEDPEYYSPAVAMDLAVVELENRDIIKSEELDDALPDGEPNYSIRLTEHGEEFVRQGKRHISKGQML